MLTLLIVTLYNVADAIWISGLGSEPLVALGLITPLSMVTTAIGYGIGIGVNSLISRYIGAEKYTQANNTGIHALLLSIIFSVIPSVIILIFLKPMLVFLGAGTSLKYAMDYSFVLFSFLFISVVSTVFIDIFRGEGNIKKVTFALIFSSLLNYILDPVCIYWLNLGIAGSAWASTLSSLSSIILLVYWLRIKKNTFLSLSFKNYSFSSKIVKKIFLVAIPDSLQTLLQALMFIVVTELLLKAGGHTAVAAVTASFQVIRLVIIPLNGLGVALITVAGVAYGAKNSKNLKTAYYHSIKIGFLITLVIVIIIFLFSSQIAYMFSYNSQNAVLQPHISLSIKFLCLYVLVANPSLISFAFFLGVGNGIESFKLNILGLFLFESIFAYIFGLIFSWGVEGIYAGLIFGGLLGSIISYIFVSRFLKRFEKVYTNNFIIYSFYYILDFWNPHF